MKTLFLAALLGAGLAFAPQAAPAAALPTAGGVTLPASPLDAVTSVDWRPYYHCHRTYRGRYCHGPRRHYRRHYAPRRHWHRRHYHRRWR